MRLPDGKGQDRDAYVFVCAESEFSRYADGGCSIMGGVPLHGNVSKAGLYQVIAFNLANPVVVTLRNPNSNLDANQLPCLFEKPILAGLSGLLFIFWFGNWLMHFTLTINLHECFTMTYLFCVLYGVIHFGELWHYHYSDDHTSFTEVRVTIKFVFDTLMLATVLMAAKGWSIVRTSLTKKQVAVCFIATLLYSVPSSIIENVVMTKAWVLYLCLAFMVFGLFVYVRDVVHSVYQSLAYVLAHMMVIAEEGFDVKTTPIWQKYVMFRGLQWGLIAYMPLRLGIETAVEVFKPAYWIGQTLNDFLTLAWLTASAVLFRLRRVSGRNYMAIGDQSQEPRQFDRGLLEGVSIDSDQMQQGTRMWEEGTQLPPQPIFIDEIGAPANKNDDGERETVTI